MRSLVQLEEAMQTTAKAFDELQLSVDLITNMYKVRRRLSRCRTAQRRLCAVSLGHCCSQCTRWRCVLEPHADAHESTGRRERAQEGPDDESVATTTRAIPLTHSSVCLTAALVLGARSHCAAAVVGDQEDRGADQSAHPSALSHTHVTLDGCDARAAALNCRTTSARTSS